MSERWAEQVEFERLNGETTCDSCWMLPEVYDALQATLAALEPLTHQVMTKQDVAHAKKILRQFRRVPESEER